MGINGLENMKKNPVYAHMYRAPNGIAPLPGERAETICGVTHTVPSKQDLAGVEVCPNCAEINQSFGGRFSED